MFYCPVHEFSTAHSKGIQEGVKPWYWMQIQEERGQYAIISYSISTKWVAWQSSTPTWIKTTCSMVWRKVLLSRHQSTAALHFSASFQHCLTKQYIYFWGKHLLPLSVVVSNKSCLTAIILYLYFIMTLSNVWRWLIRNNDFVLTLGLTVLISMSVQDLFLWQSESKAVPDHYTKLWYSLW